MKYVNRFLFAGLLLILTGCSSQNSKDNLDTLLCWLRPSCLPSHAPATRSHPPPRAQTTPVKSLIPESPPPCLTTAKTTVTSKQPSITISYVEPTTQVDGTPLTNLAKTSIYRNAGKGFIKTKDVPATSGMGGGKITETLSVAVDPGQSIDLTICVTATNNLGVEG